MEAVGVGQHGADERIETLLGRPAKADRFQMELDGRERGFKLVRHLGDDVALLQIQVGLAVPVDKDHVHADQDQHSMTRPSTMTGQLAPCPSSSGRYFSASSRNW